MTFRRAIFKPLLKVHMALGLAAGLLLTVTAVSGSAVVFKPEIDRLLHPARHAVRPPPGTGAGAAPAVRLQAAVDAARAAHPDRRLDRVTLPRAPDEPVTVRLRQPPGGDIGDRAYVTVDPARRTVLGSTTQTGHPTGWLVRLHIDLLAGDAGGYVVGGGGIVLLLVGLTGLYLWWPGWRKLRLGFAVNRRAGWKRLVFDLHRSAGGVSAPFLLVLALTGALLTFGEFVRRPVAAVLGADPVREMPAVTPSPSGPRPLDELVRAAEAAIPGTTADRLYPACDPSRPLAVLTTFGHAPARGRNWVWLDPYTGRVLHVSDARRAPAGTRLLDHWTFPTHTGEIAGVPGRAAACLAGLAVPALYASGFVMWCNRLLGRRRLRRRAATARLAEAGDARGHDGAGGHARPVPVGAAGAQG